MNGKRDLTHNLRDVSPSQLVTILAWMIVIAVFVIGGDFWLYFINFGSIKFSAKLSDWGELGEFIGGTSGPILSLLALVAVVLTVVLQSRQLELSSEEMQNTRRELKRSSDAQELAARLNALTVLFVEYRQLSDEKDAEFRRVTSAPPIPGGTTSFMNAVQRERNEILSTKNKIFRELEKVAGIAENAQQSAEADGP